MLELIGSLIKVIVLVCVVVVVINPLVFLVFLFRFVSRARLLKGLIRQVEAQGEITDVHHKATSLYARSYLDETYQGYPVIEHVHEEMKGNRNFLLVSIIVEIVCIWVLNHTVFK
jgi:hypothetical protein